MAKASTTKAKSRKHSTGSDEATEEAPVQEQVTAPPEPAPEPEPEPAPEAAAPQATPEPPPQQQILSDSAAFDASLEDETHQKYEDIKRGELHITDLQKMTVRRAARDRQEGRARPNTPA